MINYYLNAIFISNTHRTLNLKMVTVSSESFTKVILIKLKCVYVLLSLYLGCKCWTYYIGSGGPNGVKFDITNPEKITKVILSYNNFYVYAFISFIHPNHVFHTCILVGLNLKQN